MAGIIITSNFAKSLKPVVDLNYGLTYNQWPLQIANVFEMKKSNQNFEEHRSLWGVGLPQQMGETDPVVYDDMQQGFGKFYQHVKYGIGFQISQDAVDDQRYLNVAAEGAKMLGLRMRQAKDIIGTNVLNRAFSSSYQNGADGKRLCTTDHVLGKSNATLSNVPTTAVALSELAIENAYISIRGFTDDNNQKIMVRMKSLVIPKELRYEAARILHSPLQSGTANNDLVALRDTGDMVNIIELQYLTSASAYFFLTDCPNGLQFFTRKETGVELDKVFDNDVIKYRTVMRISSGWTDFRAIYGCAPA